MGGPSLIVRPERTINELRTLQRLTGDERGAQRVAFTQPWQDARVYVESLIADLPVRTHVDGAGNLWFTLQGEIDRALVIGGHLDSVPNGGWLDGCLNVLAGVEVLRAFALAYAGRPPVTVRLVDWADEEGARFGRSLFGSSAVAGQLDLNTLEGLYDLEGRALYDVIAEYGLSQASLREARRELAGIAAYLELHIEQGPVLEERNQPLGLVLGTMGVNRKMFTFHGQPAHSGTTPMTSRKDALLMAAKFILNIYQVTTDLGGVCTAGRTVTYPGAVNCVVGQCEVTLEQRCLDVKSLREMDHAADRLAEQLAKEAGGTISIQKLWYCPPVPFSQALLKLGNEVLQETIGQVIHLPSGAIHDASSMAAAGIPSAMIFVRSCGGHSHNVLENSSEEDLKLSVQALVDLTEKVLKWIHLQHNTEGIRAMDRATLG